MGRAKTIVSWSGGKDSCFACYLALAQGYEVTHLVNLIYREFRRVCFQGTEAHLISQQAEAIGTPLVQRTVPSDVALYEEAFKKVASAQRRRGSDSMVFGDIYTDEHRDWIERVCAEVGLTPVLPLWGGDPERILEEFIEAGFVAVVISAKADILGQEWLGREVDHQFLADLKRLAPSGEIDVCGERGEYHTLVLDGPLFSKRMEVSLGARTQRNGYWFLDIPTCTLRSR
jgi:diphthine-ammonia ligase